MALERITAEQIAQMGVVAAPDRLTGKAEQNKMVFDRLVRELVAVTYNGLLDALEAKTGAAQLGAEAFAQVNGETVQQQIRDVQGNVEALRAHEGAGHIGVEPVGRLLGETVAAQLGELLEIHEGLKQADGADFIGAEPFVGVHAGTVQGQLRAVQKNVDDIVGGMLPVDSVTTEKLAAGAVTTPKLAEGAVTVEKLAAGAVTAVVLGSGDTLGKALDKALAKYSREDILNHTTKALYGLTDDALPDDVFQFLAPQYARQSHSTFDLIMSGRFL